jgi:transcriptional regulator with XRE-family HTH domain
MELHLTDTKLMDQLGEAFGIYQLELGQLLGLSKSMVSHVRAGRRPLPATAYLPLARLTVAMQALPPDLPAPSPAADPVALARQARACRAAAARLVLEQAALTTRAAWADRRLAVLPVLRAHVLTDNPAADLPLWLVHFEAEAREVLEANGPLAQARLALRRAALLHEAALIDRLLAGEALAVVVPSEAGALS